MSLNHRYPLFVFFIGKISNKVRYYFLDKNENKKRRWIWRLWYIKTQPYTIILFSKHCRSFFFSCDFSDFSDFSSAIKSIMIPHALLGDCIKCKQYYIARNWWHILKLFYLLNWNVKKKLSSTLADKWIMKQVSWLMKISSLGMFRIES